MRKAFLVALPVVHFLTFPPVVLADAIGSENIPDSTKGGIDASTITQLIINLITFLTGLVGVLALAALVIGGILYIVSFGDESKTSRAKKIILYAVIGILVVGFSVVIINVVKGLI